MIKLVNLTKAFRGFKAVDNLNLEIRPGTLFGFLGPNGAGKTTTVKMMAGVLKPTAGHVLINGIDMARDPAEAKKCIGFVPDRPYLYEKLSASEFLHFVAGLYGLNSRLGLADRMDQLLELFDLTHWRDELIESYSHGMRQRLVMCSALLHEPSVLIVDEPMVGLDPRGARLVKEIFKERARRGTIIFMSTHSLDIAEEVCEDIGIIQRGEMIARGSAEELRVKAGVDGNLESVFLKLTGGNDIEDAASLSSH
jgi:ABC-2 type transport system ATP-binding protein